MGPIILWLVLRTLTSLLAGVMSCIRPLSAIEESIQLLPPSAPIDQWFFRAFLSPWMRWDAEWYRKIVTQGYSANDGTAPFHPLYPWLATPLSSIGLTPELSLVIITTLAGIALFFVFYKLARLDLQHKDALFALMLFAFAPPAFILFAPYPEALFLLLSVLCIYFTRIKKWWLASAMGALATLTRQQGIFLLLPMAWELWEENDRQYKLLATKWRDWLSLILLPAGYLFWIIYRALFLFDVQVKTQSIQGFIYSFLISPSAVEVVQNQRFIWPWHALYLSLSKLFTEPDMDIWTNLILGLCFIILLVISWNKLRMSYRLYSLVITLVSFSFYTGQIHPYMGLPRHLFLAFPIYIGLASLITKSWLRLLIIGVSAMGMAFLLISYVLHSWVP